MFVLIVYQLYRSFSSVFFSSTPPTPHAHPHAESQARSQEYLRSEELEVKRSSRWLAGGRWWQREKIGRRRSEELKDNGDKIGYLNPRFLRTMSFALPVMCIARVLPDSAPLPGFLFTSLILHCINSVICFQKIKICTNLVIFYFS